MPKKTTRYICAECAHEQPKWLGRCPSCNKFNTFEEVVQLPTLPGGAGAAASGSRSVGGKFSAGEYSASDARRELSSHAGSTRNSPAQLLRDISLSDDSANRSVTGISELDRVLGGGIVAGSMLLLGGDPGIGKSTLLLQICRHMANDDFRVLYVSGEESAAQIKMRANRLQVDSRGCYLLAETDIYAIRDAVLSIKPALLLIDSIQTMRLSDLTSLPGSVTQVRECAAFFTYLAKESTMSVILVGHVTKEGSFAGPRVLEHMVDTVLYFEGDDKDACRLIRAVKILMIFLKECVDLL